MNAIVEPVGRPQDSKPRNEKPLHAEGRLTIERQSGGVIIDDPLALVDAFDKAASQQGATFSDIAVAVRPYVDDAVTSTTELVTIAYAVKAWAIKLAERYFPTSG